ncbi:DUF4139 domain-containing protein [candidate division KSB1 bacterium]|nr:DUF4139 domain-containing protein [candidate division KSB1 bacterium]
MKKLFFIVALLSLMTAVLAQEKGVAITIYNQNLGLVKEVRPMFFKKGINEMKFQDVAAKIDPTSVHFKSLTAPEKVAILEQNYEYDLVSSSKLLNKYIDQEIKLYTEKGDLFRGKLLNSSPKDVILETKDGGIQVISQENIRDINFPQLPEGLITRPTLIWLLDCEKQGDHKAEVSYLTDGINWHTEYVAVVDKDDKNLELGGWVSIDNRSGATYQDAKVKLMAGEIHRVKPKRYPRDRILAESFAAKAAPQFVEKPFFEYHLYTLQRKTTIKNNQIKQISLFPNAQVKTDKILTYDGAKDKKSVRVNLEFINSKKAGLGIPLPAGKVRVYKEDEDKSLEFIGEDKIEHTPKDEKVRVFVGKAFDVVGERIQTEYERKGKRAREEEYEITLRNHKDKDVNVVVVEHLYGDWKILSSSHTYRKKTSTEVEFPVTVQAGGEVKITYRVRYRF